MTASIATEKLKKYCAYQERSHKEVVDKLYKLGLYKNEVDQVLIALIQDDFLNEERFAQAFVSGKFRIKRWGRVKIKSHLKQKHISDYCIKKGMQEIDETEYFETLHYWLERKEREVEEENEFKKKGKIAAFLIQKGFESNLVWEALRKE
ncbi:MAG: regulatory protein RecX [Flavobacteriales bacterium]|jgi:regulatory protein|tara:strand:- start:147 stop:596 length:450 start_codon:yes stop_codon:yes gene_type:complete